MGYGEMMADSQGEYGTAEQRAHEEETRKARLAEAEKREEENRLSRLAKERFEKYGQVHYVARLVIERVNAFPAKAAAGYGNDATPATRKVTLVEGFNLRAEGLAVLKDRINKRVDLVEDDEIIDPNPKGTTRDV